MSAACWKPEIGSIQPASKRQNDFTPSYHGRSDQTFFIAAGYTSHRGHGTQAIQKIAAQKPGKP
jgi:hypothetical protein